MGKATVTDVFEECQKGLHSQGKLIKKLAQVYKSVRFCVLVADILLFIPNGGTSRSW